jgi:alpha-L-fucosidase 2
MSLTLRGDGGAGWSMAWKTGCWARLGDGEQAARLLGNLLTKNTFPNLFSRCGQALQVDGTLGATAALAEMLLQSQDGEIALLPALPRAWPTGSFQGLCARDGFVVDLTWADGAPVGAEVLSRLGRDCRVRTGVPFRVRCRGKEVPVVRPGKGLAVFKTRPGESYVLSADGKAGRNDHT